MTLTQNHPTFDLDDDFDNFCSLNPEKRLDWDEKIDSISVAISKQIQLKIELNKIYKEKTDLKNYADETFKDCDQTITLEQLIKQYEQKKNECKTLMKKLEELEKKVQDSSNKRQKSRKEMECLREKRDQILLTIRNKCNYIKNKSSKIGLRTHKNSLVAMIFYNDGRLAQVLTQNKENSTKEDIWDNFYEKRFINLD